MAVMIHDMPVKNYNAHAKSYDKGHMSQVKKFHKS